jgi:putative transposase
MVREWTCGGCGVTHDRDLNAAKNILKLGRQLVAAGRAETLNARGGQVRPQRAAAQAVEAGTRRSELAGAARRAAVGISRLQAGEDVNG